MSDWCLCAELASLDSKLNLPKDIVDDCLHVRDQLASLKFTYRELQRSEEQEEEEEQERWADRRLGHATDRYRTSPDVMGAERDLPKPDCRSIARYYLKKPSEDGEAGEAPRPPGGIPPPAGGSGEVHAAPRQGTDMQIEVSTTLDLSNQGEEKSATKNRLPCDPFSMNQDTEKGMAHEATIDGQQ